MVATGHIFEDTMATCHPPGIVSIVAGTSSPARPQECVHEDMLTHLCILSSSVPSPWRPSRAWTLKTKVSVGRRQRVTYRLPGAA